MLVVADVDVDHRRAGRLAALGGLHQLVQGRRQLRTVGLLVSAPVGATVMRSLSVATPPPPPPLLSPPSPSSLPLPPSPPPPHVKGSETPRTSRERVRLPTPGVTPPFPGYGQAL